MGHVLGPLRGPPLPLLYKEKGIDAGPGAKPVSHRDTRDELWMGLPKGVLI